MPKSKSRKNTKPKPVAKPAPVTMPRIMQVMDGRDWTNIPEQVFRDFITRNKAAGTLRMGFDGEPDPAKPSFYRWVLNIARGLHADGSLWQAVWQPGTSLVIMRPANA